MQGSYNGCDAMIVEIARNQVACFIERPGSDFEQIGVALFTHYSIYASMVIQSYWKKI